MDLVEPVQLDDRIRMVIDPQVDERVRQAAVAAITLHDEQGSGLLAASVAAGRLRRREGLDQPLRECPAGARLPRRRERLDGRPGDEEVALRRKAGAPGATGPVHALRAGE